MPGGRPSKIDQVVRTRQDGSTVTAGDEIITRVELGAEYATACDSAKISRATLHNWRLAGERARADQAKGRRLTAAQARYAEFLDALETAEANQEVNRLAVIERAAQPQTTTTTTVTEKLDNTTGTVLERTTVTTTRTSPGAWQAAAWFLERRKPERYQRRIELTGKGGTPLMEPAARANVLADEAEAYLEARAEAAGR